MKLKIEIPQSAKIKVISEYNNTMCIYDDKNNLQYILVNIKGGGTHGKD